MLISRLRNLDQETAGEIAGNAIRESDYDRLINNLHNEVEVAVLCQAVPPAAGDPPIRGYYDIAFADGSIAPAVSGYHLRGIENWGVPKPLHEMPTSCTASAIEAMWTGRAKEQGLKPGTKTYQRAELEFFTGAIATLNVLFPHELPDRVSNAVPVGWLINAMSGRSIAEKE
jgi:hypothetical protein